MVRLTAPRTIRDPASEPFETILYKVDRQHKVAYITLNRYI